MRKNSQTALVLMCALLLGVAVNAGDMKVSPADPAWGIEMKSDITPPSGTKSADDYWVGTVRVFLSEPMGRWTDAQGFFYKHAFVDQPIVNNVNLDDGDVRYFTAEWDAADATFLTVPMIFENNIEAIAVAFNGTSVPTYADPPAGYLFDARYSDAAAVATPGAMGQNQSTGGFTHTVFLEESTATT